MSNFNELRERVTPLANLCEAIRDSVELMQILPVHCLGLVLSRRSRRADVFAIPGRPFALACEQEGYDNLRRQQPGKLSKEVVMSLQTWKNIPIHQMGIT
jgi:hypothetical protein